MSRGSNNDPTPRDAVVVKSVGGWTVRNGAKPTQGLFRTKAEAIREARRALSKRGGVLRIQDANGRVVELVTLGRDVAVRLNGIEGVALNEQSRRLVRAIQASGLSPAGQRRAVLNAFKKS